MRITKRKLLYFVILPNLLVFTFLASYFPGAHLPIALTLASGIYRGALQERIDACETKAIHGADFTEEEVAFLKEFYMPDFSNIDSVFGLYYGHIEAVPEITGDSIRIRWRAEVPWEWPSYESLKEKHGDYHAESFPIPNAACLIFGIDGAVFIDNGLGEYLTQLGIAKSFLAYAKWEETLKQR